MKPIIKLNQERIKDEIQKGDNCNGSRVLAVAPDGSDHRIHWMENNRQWDPWPEGWLIIGIPALFPDGTGEENELAESLLRDYLPNEDEPHDADHIMEKLYQADISIHDYIEGHFSTEWNDYVEEATDWLAEAFLAACNGYGQDLNMLSPWGYTYEEDGYPEKEIEPPAEFEWA